MNAGGSTISLDGIADRVGLSKSSERFQWVRTYFQAKARLFASAGYPEDTGGYFLSVGIIGNYPWLARHAHKIKRSFSWFAALA